MSQQIATGEIMLAAVKADMAVPRTGEWSRRAGVSTETVRKVIRGEYVSPETRCRVLAVVGLADRAEHRAA